MPPSLPTLRHDDVNSAGDRLPSLFGASDRTQNESARIVDPLDIASGISEKQGHDPQTGLEGLIEATVLIGGENQVAAEGTIGQRCRLANHVSDRIEPGQRHHAEPAGIRNRCRQFGRRHHRR